MLHMFTNDVDQQALGFLVSQTTYIEPTVYKIKYADLNYSELVPIDIIGTAVGQEHHRILGRHGR